MVKHAAGWFMQARRESAEVREPHRVWIYRTVLTAIREGSLPPGSRLPSGRQLAAEWGVTRGAADDAFAQLQAEALIERRVGDGSYVSGVLPRELGARRQPVLREPNATTLRVLHRFGPVMNPIPCDELSPRPLRPMMPAVQAFPLATWRRIVARSMQGEGSRGRLDYGAPSGLDALREATARHLSLTQAARCEADQVIVVNGVLQAYELIASVLLEPGDTVALEDPGYVSTARLLAIKRLEVVGVPIDEGGFSVSVLAERAPRAAAVFLHTFNQFPTGIVTCMRRATELMAWAERSGAWIIDTHYMREVAHDAAPPAGLSLLDASERTLTVGTYAGMCFPSLRLAYLVVPERLVDVFVAVRGLMGDHCAVLNQWATAAFIDEGHASRHLRHVRALYRQRRDCLRSALQRLLPDWAVPGPMAGAINAAVRLPPSVRDRDVVASLEARGVTVGALSAHSLHDADCNGLVIGYGAYDAAAIEDSIAKLAEVLGDVRPV